MVSILRQQNWRLLHDGKQEAEIRYGRRDIKNTLEVGGKPRQLSLQRTMQKSHTGYTYYIQTVAQLRFGMTVQSM